MGSILIVDDDAGFLSAFSEAFFAIRRQWPNPERMDLMMAKGVREGVEFLRREGIDLCVVGLRMKPVDGLQFIRLLRQNYPRIHAAIVAQNFTHAERQAAEAVEPSLIADKPRTEPQARALCQEVLNLLDSPRPVGFTGVLPKADLRQAIEALRTQGGSAVVRVDAGRQQGRLYIENGTPLHAEMPPHRHGDQALQAMLALPSGEFTLQAFRQPPHLSLVQNDGEEERGLQRPDASVSRLEDRITSAHQVPGEGRSTESADEPAALTFDEWVVFGAQGEVRSSHGCPDPELRSDLIDFVQFQIGKLNQRLQFGPLRCLSIEAEPQRCVLCFEQQGNGFALRQHTVEDSPPGTADRDLRALRSVIHAPNGYPI
jgi:CheY-like chemotaxis protein